MGMGMSGEGRGLSRGEFLWGVGAAAAGVLAAASSVRGQETRAGEGAPATRGGRVYDLREFVKWVVEEFEPSVRVAGGAGSYARTPGGTSIELYGISDMACILYTLGLLHPTEKERSEWAAGFQTFQVAGTGMLVEKANPTHPPLHNTAFALAAMELLELRPELPVRMGAEHQHPREFLNALDWKKRVYPDSHKGAGMGAIFALVPELGTPAWFAEYFAACDELFDPNNGLMGKEKPKGGDSDQVGGTFHYSFLYNAFNRRMPYPERRIDAVLGLQGADGYWDKTNRTWLTLDAVYLLTRTVRFTPYRVADVEKMVRGLMDILMDDLYSVAGRKKVYTGRLAVHSLTCAISIAAEAQQFLGAEVVVTERPLRLVLDRRPFI